MSATQTGSSLTFTYDALGRKLTEAGPLGTATSTWNLDGTRATLALPGGGITETYDRDVTGLVTKVRENGASSGIGVLATYTYDNLQRRTAVANGNGTSSSYSFDPVSRLASLTQDLAGTLNDLTISISAYNPSSQIVTQSRSNDLYAWTGHGNGSTDTVTNGLNQLSTVGGVAASHDARGNLTLDPASGNSYAYSSENLLTSATVGGNGVTLAYDPLLRLTQVAGTATTRFGYDGLETLAEADGGGTILRRYAPGDGVDEPVVWYEGTGTADRRWLHADERGSVVAVSDASGNMLGINAYDEYGKPGASNIGRFQYTGQKWLPEIGGYDYKARIYSPALGRFLQTDPAGYAAGPNIYAYVRGDPVNLSDPFGLGCDADTWVCGSSGGGAIGGGYGSPGGSGSVGAEPSEGRGDFALYGPPPCIGNCSPIIVKANPSPKSLSRTLVSVGLISAEVIDAATKAMRDLLQQPKLSPKPSKPPKPDKTRSQCAGAVAGAAAYGMEYAGAREIIRNGLAIGRGMLTGAEVGAEVGGGVFSLEGAVAGVAIGGFVYYLDQQTNNGAADILRNEGSEFGVGC